MKIEEIFVKNFKPYGPEGMRLTFPDGAGMNLLSASNGAGKSSIAVAIIYMLYGKNPDGNIGDLPNWANPNDMYGYIRLRAKNQTIEIERAKRMFKIFIDGEEYEQAGKSNMQDFLETEFYDLSYYVFKNLLVLSINDFKSFLSMTPRDKRRIVDKIFGFSLLNEMRELNKKFLRDASNDLNNVKVKITQLEKNIKKSEDHLEKIEKELKKESDAKANELRDKLAKRKESIKKAEARISKLQAKKDEIDGELSTRRSAVSKIRNKLDNIAEKKRLYENDKCPTCSSDLHTEHHKNLLNDYHSDEIEQQKRLEAYKKELNNFKKKSKKLKKRSGKLNKHISTLQSQSYSINERLENLSNSPDRAKAKHLEELIDDFDENRKKNKKKAKRKKKEERFYQVADELLSENGIKSTAIKTILPKLNLYLQEQIKEMHLKYSASFDDNFDVELSYFGEEVPVSVLSSGEKKKYDFAILIAILKLIKMKYQNLNLLFLDEIFSSVDADGRHSILQILRDIVEEFNMQAVLINHSELPLRFFDRWIEIESDNYSKLKISEI